MKSSDSTAQQIAHMVQNGERQQQEHLLDCLARHIIKLPKHRIISLSEKMAKHQTPEFMDDLRVRIKREQNESRTNISA